MTEETLERANSIVQEKKVTEGRLEALRTLAKHDEEPDLIFTVTHRVEQFAISLTRDDIDVLIDHEEMKLVEYDRKFKEL